jgi:phenylacetate-CoA ligase
MRDYGTTVLTGFPDYIRHLARVAIEEGFDPKTDFKVRMICTQLGQENRTQLSEVWGGAEVYDLYGVADVGMIAGEVKGKTGMYLMEDAFHVGIVNADTLSPLPDGHLGNICVTAISPRFIYPIVRFNTNDVSAFEARDFDASYTFKRLRGFHGRSDNMAKLRGINVYPQAIGMLILEVAETTGEFCCRVQRNADRDEMVVMVEATESCSDRDRLKAKLSELLTARVGVDLVVEIVGPNQLAPVTGLEARQKPIRLIDSRKS